MKAEDGNKAVGFLAGALIEPDSFIRLVIGAAGTH